MNAFCECECFSAVAVAVAMCVHVHERLQRMDKNKSIQPSIYPSEKAFFVCISSLTHATHFTSLQQKHTTIAPHTHTYFIRVNCLLDYIGGLRNRRHLFERLGSSLLLFFCVRGDLDLLSPPLSLSRSPLSLSLILSHTYTLSLSLSTHLKKKQGTTALTYDDACRLGHSFSSTITPFLDRFLFKSPQMYYNNLLKSLVIQSSQHNDNDKLCVRLCMCARIINFDNVSFNAWIDCRISNSIQTHCVRMKC